MHSLHHRQSVLQPPSLDTKADDSTPSPQTHQTPSILSLMEDTLQYLSSTDPTHDHLIRLRNYTRLLGPDKAGWTMFTSTTIRAILAIKKMLADADFPAGFKASFQPLFAQVRWHFTSCYLAIDFVAAYGLDDIFGSATDRSVYLRIAECRTKNYHMQEDPDRIPQSQHLMDLDTIETGAALKRNEDEMDALVPRTLHGFPSQALQHTPTDFMTNAGKCAVSIQYCANRQLFRLLTLLTSRIGTNTSFYSQTQALSTGDISLPDLAMEHDYTNHYDMAYSSAQPAKRLRTRLLSMWREVQQGNEAEHPLPLVFEVKGELAEQTTEVEEAAGVVPKMSLHILEDSGPSGTMDDGTWLFGFVIQLAALL